MYKYKYFLLLFTVIATLLLWYLFPVSFDNNDDQAMYAISAGIFSGISFPNLILTNVIIGKALNNLFLVSKQINFYTLYLQVVLLLCLLGFSCLFLKNKNTNFLSSVFIILFIFLGFFSLCIVKLQFTTVALFACFAALFFLQSEISRLIKFICIGFFIVISILIRKDVFYVFLLFSVPVFFIRIKEQNFIREFITTSIFICFVFFLSSYFNNHNYIYQQQHTYNNVNALDIIAANPIKVDDNLLQENNFTKDDIALMQSWFVADEAYLSGRRIEQLANKLKTNRNINAANLEFKKFVEDERYVLFVYILTILIVLIFARKFYKVVLFNLLVFVGLLMYLTIAKRIPHRVTFPIITYLILINIFYFFKKDHSNKLKINVIFLLFILSCYKFYCTFKLMEIQKENHLIFANCASEINTHPNHLFIAIDDFPLQYMNAWQKPENMFPAHNVILTGWYACTPDYQVLLAYHQLKNLTSDIKKKNNVLFLTNSATLQNAYIKVMRQRYNIVCHFENAQAGFKMLHPKKLVVDN